jgi:hypothetical protein
MTSPNHGSARGATPYRASGRIRLIHGDTLSSTDYRDRLKRLGPRCTLQPWAERSAHEHKYNYLCKECARAHGRAHHTRASPALG